MITKFDIFLNEGYEEDYRKEYEERFGKKQTYEELKDKFKIDLVGSCAQWDEFMDIASCTWRLLQLKDKP